MQGGKAVKNVSLNIIYLGINTLLSFILRTCMVKYLGIEILGINATIAETVNLLSMSELGIQTSVTYKMYKPIIDGNKKRQQELFNMFKVAYRLVGIVIILLSIVILPFIPRIVNTELDMSVVYTVYIMQIGAVALRYFLLYFRLIFLTNQRQYVYVWHDIIINSIGIAVQVFLVAVYKNYFAYLLVNYAMLMGNFILIYRQAKKDYSEIIKKCSIKRQDIKELFQDIKELIVGTISGYMYGSTDNILISYFFGSVVTGLISNYKLVLSVIRAVISSISTAVTPTWGAFLNRDVSEEEIWNNYQGFIFLEFICCMFLLLPTLFLIDSFIVLWIGNQFIFDKGVSILIVLDLFMASLNEPICIIMKNLGMFREEKRVSVIAAFVNIISSIVLTLVMGVHGIFLGTVITVTLYWAVRGWYVNKRCFGGDKQKYFYLWLNNIEYLLFFGIMYIGLNMIFEKIIIDCIWKFILVGIAIECFVAIVIYIFWNQTERMCYVKKILGRLKNEFIKK